MKLFGERVVPVCSPGLIAKRPLDKPEDLRDFVLLHFEDAAQATPWISWEVWFEVMKMKPVSGRGVLRFSHYDQLVRAAVNGQGVALGRLPLIAGLLQDGTLVMPLRGPRFATTAADRAYWLIVSQAAAARSEVQTFAQWLRGQATAMAQPNSAV